MCTGHSVSCSIYKAYLLYVSPNLGAFLSFRSGVMSVQTMLTMRKRFFFDYAIIFWARTLKFFNQKLMTRIVYIMYDISKCHQKLQTQAKLQAITFVAFFGTPCTLSSIKVFNLHGNFNFYMIISSIKYTILTTELNIYTSHTNNQPSVTHWLYHVR